MAEGYRQDVADLWIVVATPDDFDPTASAIERMYPIPVGAAEGCDLLILTFSNAEQIKIKRSQPSAAPTL
ncbi:hypothetical protein [Pseudomonas sp. TH31]|uniref:hypothetical protein n=1 Tax=Pseudomonas sp. TH31 TaxID=2796396 RepID=UPI001911E9BB|nr:hypothetical protein [Pseudomonas sp. TH31]MBK5414319.1 hypothetical protein [Pseudomonas sp. TH31]